jgi:signal transduction histidine kinase
LRLDRLSAAVQILQENRNNLASFLANDPKGQRVIPYLEHLVVYLEEEQTVLLKELDGLTRNVEHIKEIVSVQQGYAKVSGITEILSLAGLLEDALQMNRVGLDRQGIRLIREFDHIPPIMADKHKILQIFLNLIRNAEEAMKAMDQPDRFLHLRIQRHGEGHVRIQVQDSGVGLNTEQLTRIFSHGFTTKRDGHGFGLHWGALAARQLWGSLSVESQGLGLGATFTLDLPVQIPSGNTPDRMELQI